jgi:hypothetical protein
MQKRKLWAFFVCASLAGKERQLISMGFDHE